ncbi:hypothetical protein TWF694_011018 [Orbilia ellipsospora]|uniref:von Hippel-Lindau disease tumour suppressor beta domain-containing protein n=1 Tax=Orbilia ellipsospora TaxID=2528407 RepID=A0AAV9X905_9PEZI
MDAMIDPQPYLLQAVHPDNEPATKTVASTKAVKVYFINNRTAPVHIYWLDTNGKRVSYGTVAGNGGTKEQGTYLTNPWIVTDEGTGKALAIYHPGPRDGRAILL